jgi:hypothetical protein
MYIVFSLICKMLRVATNASHEPPLSITTIQFVTQSDPSALLFCLDQHAYVICNTPVSPVTRVVISMFVITIRLSSLECFFRLLVFLLSIR